METIQAMTPEMESLKTRLKRTWEAGDYAIFAEYLLPGAIEFFDRLNIAPGTKLLDIGCGAGQLTVPASQMGIDVTGVDLAQNLVDHANVRLESEGLSARVFQGDAENLAFPDETFDCAISFIGSMFAPRPELVASEMVRVCKPGARLIMGNWTPEGHIRQMFKVIGSHVPPPAIFPSPLLWGKEDVVRERFGSSVTSIQITRKMFPFKYPMAPDGVVDFYIEYYGPTLRAYASLSEEQKPRLRNELIDLWERNNEATDGTTSVSAEYVEVIGTRA